MKVGGFIVLCGAVQALLIALMVVTPHPAGIDRNPKPMPTVAAAMECLALHQNLNHLMLQLFDWGHLQQGHDLLDLSHHAASQNQTGVCSSSGTDYPHGADCLSL